MRVVELLDVEVLHVELEVGDAPGDPLVVPHDDARRARQRDARNVQPGRLEMGHVPDAGQRSTPGACRSRAAACPTRCGCRRWPRHWSPGCTSPPDRIGNRNFTFSGSPSASMLRLIISSRQVVVRSAVHVEADQHANPSTLHGRGW